MFLFICVLINLLLIIAVGVFLFIGLISDGAEFIRNRKGRYHEKK